MKLNEKILLLRKKAGLSQEELANELDISRQAVYKWETAAASPDLDKIKQLAKFFNVSFDYLMNDEIDVYETQNASRSYHYTRRGVFNIEEKIAINHGDIDNGYTENRKSVNKHRQENLELQVSRAKEAMKAVGATEFFFLQMYTSIAFFYDENKKACGFYYNGKIQFVCPIENILSFSFGTGGIISENAAHATLCYTDSDASLKSIRIDFSSCNYYSIGITKTVEEMQQFFNTIMRSIATQLNNLKNKIDGLKLMGERILDESIQVAPIDYNIYKKSNEKTGKEYNDYLAEISEDAKRADSLRRKKILSIIAGAVIGVIVLISVL